MKSATLALAALLAVALLPSCQWNIGECIRSGSIVRVGADISRATVHYVNPAPKPLREGEHGLYKVEFSDGAHALSWCREDGEGKGTGGRTLGARTEYMLAPEVTYRIRKPEYVVDTYAFWSPSPWRMAEDVKPTGRMLLVKPQHQSEPQLVASLPEGLEAEKPFPLSERDVFPSTDTYGSFDSPLASRGSVSAQIAAAPFDFVIDPALSLASSVAIAVPTICFVAVAEPIYQILKLIDEI